MLMHDDPTKFAEESLLIRDGAMSLETAGFPVGEDGYRCLEACGDDLSLENTPLIDMDDLLYS